MKKIISLVFAVFCTTTFAFAGQETTNQVVASEQFVANEKAAQVLRLVEEVNDCKDLTTGQKFSMANLILAAAVVGLIFLNTIYCIRVSERVYGNMAKGLALACEESRKCSPHGLNMSVNCSWRDDLSKPPVWNDAHNELHFEQLTIKEALASIFLPESVQK